MGIGEGSEDGYGWVDPSAGTIVWVRRRNGSWWPGRILGPEELPATHLGVSPRSGTPVKLLGREDASVDWYNLEKSKRVKAFRCGEFDDCIERAEASLGAPIKKREKYARREDAILHALELEKQQKQEEISNCLRNNNPGDQRREFYFSSDISLRDDEPRVRSEHSKNKPETISSVVFPFKEESVGGALYDYNGESAKDFSSEDDIPEAMPPMQGLLDFGYSSKRTGVNWDPSSGHTMGGTSYDDSSQNFILAKMKIASGGLSRISLGKKRDRRRPLAQVLRSSAKLSLPPSFHSDQETDFTNMQRETDRMGAVKRTENSSTVHSPARSNDFLDDLGYPPEQMPSMAAQFGLDSFGDESSRVIELNESDSSEKYYLESDTENVANFFTDTDSLEHGLKDSGRDIHCDAVPYQIPDRLGNINTDERALTSHIHEFPFHKQAALFPSELGFSKWHMKGKRNVRNLAKRPMGPVDGTKTFSGVNKSDGFSEAIAYDNKLSSSKMREVSPFSHYSTGRCFYNKRGEFRLDVDLIGNDYLTGHDGQRDSPMLKAGKYHEKNHNSFHVSVSDSHCVSPSGWEGDEPSHMFRRAYWMESEECFEPVYADHLSELEPMLVDVDLKVQAASYRRERVPLVSLMSRLNGNAIVGHPVQIEILENGRNDALREESPAPPSFWRTARRTAMQRVPRSNPLMSTLGGGDAEYLQHLDIKNKTLIKKPHQVRFATNSQSNTPQLISGKFQKHFPKRGSLSCQKSRELSSVATRHELGGENIHVELSKNGCVLGGLIKPEDGMVPLVTCVPFKVVFSRILEAVGRPSSTVIR